IKINPCFVQAYMDLGNAYGEKGLFKEAVEAYFGALRIAPDDAEIHFALGEVYLTRLHNKKRALFYFQRSLELNPHHPRAEQIRDVIKILE
ncbi:MAG: tetratricopeptide repeat protein, partial [Syntrophales bacterium]|nr:tetratricopeptide repeat protein [Syntrophales bacterium]